jgi:N-acetyl-anhydromuramyl-L-alanine amidase AmpD
VILPQGTVLRAGDKGPAVAWWRDVLERDGYRLSGPDNIFDASTHNATVAWQRARPPLKRDGVVGPKTIAAIGQVATLPPPAAFDPASIPYVEAANWQRDAGEQSKSLIVLHCMEYLEASTSAEWCAAFFAGRRGMKPPRSSAHYCIDSDSIVACVPRRRIAWHAPGANQRGIGLEHAGFARQSRAEWLDDYTLAMLQLSSKLTAWLCT